MRTELLLGINGLGQLTLAQEFILDLTNQIYTGKQVMKLATLCYIKQNDCTLMLHRNSSATDIHYGKWNGLGGKFEVGETPEECVIREVLEESGLTIIKPSLRGVLTFPEFKNGEDWYVFLFTASEFTGELSPSREGDLCWVKDGEIAKLHLWEGDHYFMDWLNSDRFFSGMFCYRNGKLLKHNVTFY